MQKYICLLALFAGASLAASESRRLKFVDPSSACRVKSAKPILGNA
jgi:hypothetical protein